MSTLIENLNRYFAVAAVALLGVVYSTSVLAVGTDADTDIDNIATVNYEVGGIARPPVDSPTTTFKVDQVVDLTVAEADGAQTPVVPNQVGAIARFTVTNTGNEVQDFGLSINNIVADVFGVTDNFDPSLYTIVIDANGDDVYDAGDTVANYIDELSADDLNPDPLLDNVVSVFVLATIPNQSIGDGANFELVAEAREGGTAASQGIVQAETGGANTDGLEVVWSNNTDSDNDSYEVVAAPALVAAKDSEVLSDPLLNVSPNALAIPGAIVEYTVTITNSGALAATNVSVSDTLQSDLTFFDTFTYSGNTANVSITVGAVTTFCIAESGGTDTNADGCVLTGSVLTVAPAGLTADEVANAPDNVVEVRFQVSIN